MKNRNPDLLSFKKIELGDLRHLLALARQDRQAFFQRYPEWRRYYAKRILGTALCQGAAVHYIDRTAGINDFDVYTFYAANPARRWYSKRMKSVDFGDPKFGVSELSRPEFRGRRVDLLARALDTEPGADVVMAIQSWLIAGKTTTARELSQKAVILLEPEDRLGHIVWQRPCNLLSLSHESECNLGNAKSRWLVSRHNAR